MVKKFYNPYPDITILQNKESDKCRQSFTPDLFLTVSTYSKTSFNSNLIHNYDVFGWISQSVSSIFSSKSSCRFVPG